MGKSLKKYEGSDSGAYKRQLRKEKRINLHQITKKLESGDLNAEVDYYGSLYNTGYCIDPSIFITKSFMTKFISKYDCIPKQADISGLVIKVKRNVYCFRKEPMGLIMSEYNYQ